MRMYWSLSHKAPWVWAHRESNGGFFSQRILACLAALSKGCGLAYVSGMCTDVSRWMKCGNGNMGISPAIMHLEASLSLFYILV